MARLYGELNMSNSTFDAINDELNGVVNLPYQASFIGYEIFIAIVENGLEKERAIMLVNRFHEKLDEWNMKDIVLHQMEYAKRLASLKSNLEYEDTIKLRTLCEEIYALKFLGLTVDPETETEYLSMVSKICKMEHAKLADMVALHKYNRDAY